MLPFTPTDLLLAVSDGRVTAREHPSLPLTIFNYSPDVQYSNKWDEVTLACRGLILDKDFNIVARPWKKFFNLGQVNLPIQFTDPVEVMDKADGSLGILYKGTDGLWAIATRGSFASEQAIHATEILRTKYEGFLHTLDTYWSGNIDTTILFEIVYPQNRIVLDYDGMDDLILLGGVHMEMGYYYGPKDVAATYGWNGPVVEVFEYNTISDALAHMGRSNAEGYVIRSHNFLVKVKEPDYVELHKLVTNASPKTVWEQLKSGKSKTEVVSAFPDEFHDYIGSMADPLIAEYERLTQEILAEYSEAVARVQDRYLDGGTPSRKEYATEFAKYQHRKFFFLLLDSRPIREVVWAMLKPKESVLDSVK